jgi:mono/diheme cytochrome c family protein
MEHEERKMMKLFKLPATTITFAVLGILLVACRSEKFTAPMKLGGKWISADTLNHGYDVYMNNCLSCHGVHGDGMGPAAQGQQPLPRNFQLGAFKFANVASGDLPRDEDLKHTIRYGLRGTGMLPWDLSDKDLEAVVHYIKTFSPVWKEKVAGEALGISKDPWGVARASEAIAEGEKIYHGLAQCWACHPTYQSMDKISQYSKELTSNDIKTIRARPHISTLLDSIYGTKYMPPDFTKNFIKTGGSVEQTYALLNAGANGSAMAAWKGMLSAKSDPEESERNQWAVAYYVNHLHKLKYNLEARTKFMQDLNERRAKYDRYDDVDGSTTK